VITSEAYEATLRDADAYVVDQRISRSQPHKTMVAGFDSYAPRRTKAAGGGGGGGGGGSSSGGDGGEGGGSSRGGGTGTNIQGTTSARHAGMFVTQERGPSTSGVIAVNASRGKPKSIVIRCCCDAATCTIDVSNSEHFCSVTGRRCTAWCTTGEEGHGNKKSPCVRCNHVEKA